MLEMKQYRVSGDKPGFLSEPRTKTRGDLIGRIKSHTAERKRDLGFQSFVFLS